MLRLIIIFVLICSVVADDKQKAELTIKEIMSKDWVGVLPSSIRWAKNSSGVYFRGKEENGNDLYMADATSLKIKPVDTTEQNGKLNPQKTKKVYTKNGDIYLVDLQKKTTKQLTKTVANENRAYFSSDQEIVFSKDQNLYSWSLETNSYEQITHFVKGNEPSPVNDKKDLAQEWLKKQQLELVETLRETTKVKDSKEKEHPALRKIYTNNRSLQNIKLSPNKNYVTFRLQKQGKAKPTLVPNYTTKSGYTKNISARNKVGTVISSSQMGIFNRQKNKVYFIDTAQIPGIKDHPQHLKDRQELRKVIIHGPFWSESTCVVVILALDNKDRWIMQLNPADGKLTLLDRQRDEAWIGGPGIGGWRWNSGNIGFIPKTPLLWFQSEETGYSHLYLYNLETNEKTQLTSGNFEIYSPKISKDTKHWYFTANKTHPGERHLFRMPIMGGKLTQITTMRGNNETYISPDESKIAIRHSFCNKPWELYLMDNKPGATAYQITNSTTKEFRSYPWRAPQIVTFPNRHGKNVYARLYESKQPTSSKKPAVIFVHGAGYLQNAHKWWSLYYREYMFHNLLVDHGYTVLDIDYSGSAGYGRDWRTAIYRHMGGKDLSDQVDGAKFLIEKCGIDSNRIGIYGGSYGGFITLMAMFKEPEVFKAGAALRSVTDWAHYNHPYTSNILNIPHEDEEAYKRSSPIYFAEGLKGALLICHGMLDDNVQFQDVIRLVQRLIELEKDNWELAVYPLERHSFIGPKNWRDEYMRIFQLFEKHLK
ncbi:prolyl oligopeptidase family serine peptidase [Candidatus Uabimicrobium sp. HlEnr_7]|uniref:S9 family peptidase n=1 Tax=Candidatus Uabimicrobium helgolandensis TaxID=3095367 RepID=UPI003556A8DE